MRLAKLLMALLVAIGLARTTSADDGASAETAPESLTDLLERATRAGSVNVIVGLALPAGFVAEGDLDPEGVAHQRAAIAATRAKLIENLRGYAVMVYASWESVPSLGMRVDARALKRLADSPHVTTIQHDSSSASHP
jgi:hypothetical protein